MAIRIQQDYFTIEEIAAQWKVSVKEIEDLIYVERLLRLAVISNEVPEITDLDDSISSRAWYGRDSLLELFIDATGLSFPIQNREGIDLSQASMGTPNPNSVQTDLLADLPKFLYLKIIEDGQGAAQGSNPSDSIEQVQNRFKTDEFENLSGEKIRILCVVDENFDRFSEEPDYRRKILNIEPNTFVISQEERDRFMRENDVEVKPLGTTERNNLLKLIGVLATMVMDLNLEAKRSIFMVNGKVNANQVATAVDQKLDAMNITDKLGVRFDSNNKKIGEGLRLLAEQKQAK